MRPDGWDWLTHRSAGKKTLQVQALPVRRFRDPWATTENPRVSVSTECTVRKSAVESSRTETGRIKHWVAGHREGNLFASLGKNLYSLRIDRTLTLNFLCLILPCPEGLGL